MRQLTATDAAFLDLEQPRTPVHLTSLLVFDRSEAPGGHGSGLFHSVMGVERRRCLSITSCRAMLPDPVFYRACLDESVAEHAALV